MQPPPRAPARLALAAALRTAALWAAVATVGLWVAPTEALAAPQRPAQPGSVASGRTPQEIYDHAMKMLKRGLYDKAEIDFQELRNFHRDDPLSVRARLGVGDMHFQQGEYEEARFAYEEFASYHPRHPDMDYVTYRIGLCHWKRPIR
jgi:outer membrane protein assembly factor BamD